MADALDKAGENEQRDRERAIARHKNRRTEKPVEDEVGNRFCLDCGDQIPEARVVSVAAVRCFECQEVVELKNR